MMWFLIQILPKKALSRTVGWFVSLSLPGFMARPLIQWFAGRYKINMNEAEKPIDQYKSIQDLFTRKLKPGIRPIGGEVVHPVDGLLTASGIIKNGQLLQVKDWTYSLEKFLDEKSVAEFEGGTFCTYYLCPTDYHRVHSPIKGQLKRIKHIDGALWPVNDLSVNRVRDLFCMNERVIFWLDTTHGPVAYVMVGATNVGSIQATVSEGQNLNPGDEMGIFQMGSTVVVVYPPAVVPAARTPLTVKMGQLFKWS